MRNSISALLAAAMLAGICSQAMARDGDFYAPFQGTGRLRFGLANQAEVSASSLGPIVRIQPDGMILLAGSEINLSPNNPAFHVLRLQANGAQDMQFGINGESVVNFDLVMSGNDALSDMALQPDGSILLAGTSDGDTMTTGTDCSLARLTSAGVLDNSFSADGRQTIGFNVGPAGEQGDGCNSVAVQHDGAILAAGYASKDAAGDYTMAIARLNTDGSPDTSFGPGQVTNKRTLDLTPLVQKSQAFKVLELSSHKILLVGLGQVNSAGPKGYQQIWTLVRLNADGSIDSNYGFGGVQIHAGQSGGDDVDIPYAAMALEDDSVVVTGVTSVGGVAPLQILVAKFTPNGSLDTSFANQGQQIVSFALGGIGEVGRAIVQDAQGRLVIAGVGDTGNNTDDIVVRLLPNGQFDTSFGVNGKRDIQLSVTPQPDYSEAATTMAIAPDGGIVMAGVAVRDVSGKYGFGIAKLIGDTLFVSGFGN